ncbi:Signal transduction histidine kinase [Actinopolymorpha cephalotaxi]|uniref:histidine kinase n=1 Tax=Actinopolymorpha cephalotaxi TaxID=504797 RepID=A0A1I2KM85_9ACTN|nr:histidine kinase [Actinopolymorpha cephalotaxi]NYH84445.1 signal transduction histidine kinase [Actinopolymorpha cephalotaxi]SFF66221.1 Signal transduction histidine kinase [Actinopolymorpha cephalotaxi]
MAPVRAEASVSTHDDRDDRDDRDDTAAQRGLDALLVLGPLVTNVGGVLAVAAHNGTSGVLGGPGTLLLLAGPALLWWRRRQPTLVLAGCVAVTWAYLLGGFPDGPVYGPLIVAVISATINGARLAAYAVVVGTLLTRLGVVVLSGAASSSLVSTTGLAAWLAFLLAVGELLRHRQELARARHQRLLMTIAAQADQARREAVEQRLRLAGEVHDVLGHQLSLINIQSNAGLHLHATQRDGVADALRTVQQASRQALEDVQAFLDSLHDPDERLTHAPAPSLGEPESLVSAARAGGLDVRVEVTGTPRRAPAPHDLAASRVVLEALTNVLKHAGPVPTWVRIDYGTDLLTVRVDNAGPQLPPSARLPRGGHGIAGMRARLETLAGTLKAGPADGFAWSVLAELPLRMERS